MTKGEIVLRAWLLCGMVLHKAVWEAMKRERRTPRGPLAVRIVKVALLAGLALQTALPEILPISTAPGRLRAAGVLLYTAGLATAVAARRQLGKSWSDIESGAAAPGHELVSRGLYRYIRHPIYAGDLLLVLGLELSLNSWLALGVAPLALVVAVKAMEEEAVLRTRLAGYEAYCRRTWRFIPYVF
jgi:protein-S-isoprenylcysteine O-methyltransferase Ste14